MITLIIISFLLSTTLTWLLFSNRLGIKLLDQPNSRSLHTTPIQRSGGLAIAATLFFMFIVNIAVLPESVINIAIGVLIIFSISIIDDIRHVPSILRLGFHLSAAGWLVYAGYGLNSVIFPGGGEILLSKPVSWLLTILLITWMTNLYNFMDGMDGFAGGMTVIGFSVLAFVFISDSQIMATVSLIVVAATLGFLIFNFPPAKIFMGDACSGFLGFTLGLMAIITSNTNAINLWSWLILLAIFIVDATVTLFRRTFNREKWYKAHRSHAYQILSRRYNSHRRVTVSVLVINLIWLFPLAYFATVYEYWAPALSMVAIAPLIIIAFNVGAGIKNN